MMKTAAIVLAAGASRRLGQPKQDILLDGETLLNRAVRTAALVGFNPIYVVISPDRSPSPNLPATILINPDSAEGMASSIRTGVLAAIHSGADGVVILACDQPAVTAGHLSLLIENNGHGNEIIVSSYANRKGVPAYFPAAVFENLLALRGDAGARSLIATAGVIPLANGEVDIDTPEDLARAQALFCTGAIR